MLERSRFGIVGVVVGCGLSLAACGQSSSPSPSGAPGTGGTATGGNPPPGSGGSTVGGTGTGGQTNVDPNAGSGGAASGGNPDAGPSGTGGSTTTTPPGARKRYMYAGNKGTVNVYDIDNNHMKVKTITPKDVGGDLRGICGSAKTHAFYLSYFGPGRVTAVDMLTDQELWSIDTAAGADRGAVSLDGTKLYIPAGEDFAAPYEYVLDTATGKMLTQFMITSKAHDTDIGASGKYAYLETKSSSTVTVIDIATNTVFKQLKFGSIVGPHVVDSADKYVYGNVFDWFGFEMMDVTTGQSIRVHGDDVNNGDGGGVLRNHGIALKPDETELWLGSKFSPDLMVFDTTVMPPKQTKRFTVGGGYGNIHWITFTIDGSYVYPAPDQNSGIPVQVIDSKTYAPTGATLSYSEDMFEADFSADGKTVVAAGNEYGIGRKIPGP